MALKACKKIWVKKMVPQNHKRTIVQKNNYLFMSFVQYLRYEHMTLTSPKPNRYLVCGARIDNIKFSGMRARRPFSPTSMRLKWSPAFYLVRKGLPEN